ncbi:MAG: SDR family oxidoreductase [Sphingomonadales bacterium]|nr:MAG: SDR family oxidoreductase [Sphingomonadales bacterium]TNF06361.1 MAG: SDR family oxidoreductase [Sphingomonadales bacterium]
MADLSGKVALVTGGTSGIGRATVQRLSRDGAKVVFTGSRQDAAHSLCDATGARFVSARVQDEADWEMLGRVISDEFGRLDIAFANAGTEHGDGSVEDILLENWNSIIGINQTGVMLTAKTAIKLMRENPGGATGSIILNSSMSAHKVMGNYMAYSVTKAAVLAMAKSIALHCATEGTPIRCNAILPGVVETEMIRAIIGKSPSPEAARAAYCSMSPMRRMGTVDEIAALVAFLGSDDAAFISGAEYAIDGASTAGMTGV